MAGIFISYRRDDSAGHAGRLYDHLSQRFGADNVFKDVAIAPGLNWKQAIETAIDRSTVLLAVIGREWLGARDPKGDPRLFAPNDVLRTEIGSALARGARVIPVLVSGARMPAESDLPEPLRPMASLMAVELRDERWDADIENLAQALGDVPTRPSPRPGPEPASPWRLRTLGAVIVGLIVAIFAAGFIAEGSYARLLGLDFVVAPGSMPALSGAQFLLDVATTLSGVAAMVFVVALVGVALAWALRRFVPGGSSKRLLLEIQSRGGLLLAAQVTALVAFVVFSLAAFPDFMPLAALVSRSGISSAPADLMARAPELYRTAVLSVLSVCLTQAGLEAWRLRVRRSARQPGSWTRPLSLLLSIPLDAICVIELLLLPVGQGLLQLPNRRQYTATVVSFKRSATDDQLRGKTLLLLAMRGESGTRVFFCPNPPRTWRDVDEAQLENTKDTRTGTILELAAEFKDRKQCEAEDLRGHSDPL